MGFLSLLEPPQNQGTQTNSTNSLNPAEKSFDKRHYPSAYHQRWWILVGWEQFLQPMAVYDQSSMQPMTWCIRLSKRNFKKYTLDRLGIKKWRRRRIDGKCMCKMKEVNTQNGEKTNEVRWKVFCVWGGHESISLRSLGRSLLYVFPL